MTKRVKIAAFKSRLSAHLREVRRGAEIVVTDREQPIARVVPIREEGRLTIRPPKVKEGFKHFKWPSIRTDIDAVKLLREDRDRRDDLLYRIIRDSSASVRPAKRP